MKKLIFIAIFGLLGPAQCNPVPSNKCDPSLMSYVYSPYRFYPENDRYDTRPLTGSCVEVTGTIVKTLSTDGNFVKPPGPDGDIHISVKPDNPNPGFLQPEQSALVVEIICAKPTSKIGIGPARVKCDGYPHPFHLSYDRLKQFQVGDHVKIIGLQVIDYEHKSLHGYGRTEIHPVSDIVRIP